MTITNPLHEARPRSKIAHSSESECYRPVRLSLSPITPAQAVTLRIQALAGALGSATALYLLAFLYWVLRRGR
jgi:hypothetical protein